MLRAVFLPIASVVCLTSHLVRADWPGGTYGLVKAAGGCPGGEVTWFNGSRYFDTEDRHAHNYFSFDPNSDNPLAGSFHANNIELEFCMKITHEHGQQTWPNGSYCILKYGDCPAGFTAGSIFWDDQDTGNSNKKEGVLPDGVYDDNTKMFFCCRGDGSEDTPMDLPTERPFVLLRYGYHCQTVRDADLTTAFVRWDDEDSLNHDAADGHHPFDDGGGDDHKLHFCVYKSAESVSIVG